MSKKFYLLVNLKSGADRGTFSYRKVTKILEQQNIEYETILSKYPRYLIKAARQLANELQNDPNTYLIVIGGDGTLNQVLNGIKQSDFPSTPLAYLPSGTGDDFARALNLQSSPEALINKLCTNPEVTEIDCGYYFNVNNQHEGYFINNLGIGLDAYVVAETNNSNSKKRWGHFSYGLNVFKAVLNQPGFPVTIKVNDEVHSFNNAYLVTTTNHPFFGGGVPILPKASPTNHLLDVVIVEKPSLLKFIYLFSKMIITKKQIKDPNFHYYGAKELEVSTKDLEYGQLDGEELGSKNFDLLFHIDKFNLLH
ncbi:diacylglycerol/lipid kinase family protein [Lactobacillus sp. PV034]|uniref:diacylglycerol/lipid kinase family protein n=1 Tax=Lactobacillus sp. PV034 TaxID=2594495 RepID=UPI00223ECD12|nr:diacylglycerol kinase family protein [Lactobacillus sp. PV034]QNQ80591.1 diacylglycerol kinase family lipid kinase [Lactobacillus sp. PV034]